MPIYDQYKPVQHFASNTNGRDFVVGDLHGCVKMFNRAIELLEFDRGSDRMFSVGDLIDRGPDSYGTAQLIYEPWFFAVRANHEQMMIDAVVHGDTGMQYVWLRNGGGWMREQEAWRLVDLARDLNKLPYIIAVGETGTDRFNVVHAEIAFETETSRVVATDQLIDELTTLTPVQKETLLWGRTMIQSGDEKWPPADELLYNHPVLMSPTYVGHTPVQGVVRVQRQIYIDCGAVFAERQPFSHERKLVIAEPNAGVIHCYVPATDTIYTDYIQDIPQYS